MQRPARSPAVGNLVHAPVSRSRNAKSRSANSAAIVEATGARVGRRVAASGLGGQWVLDRDRSWRDPGFALRAARRRAGRLRQLGRRARLCRVARRSRAASTTGCRRRPNGNTWRAAARLSRASGASTIRAKTAAFARLRLRECLRLVGRRRVPLSLARMRAAATAPPALAPVGQYKPNAFGVFDIIGNAREWVMDCFTGELRGAAAGRARLDLAGRLRTEGRARRFLGEPAARCARAGARRRADRASPVRPRLPRRPRLRLEWCRVVQFRTFPPTGNTTKCTTRHLSEPDASSRRRCSSGTRARCRSRARRRGSRSSRRPRRARSPGALSIQPGPARTSAGA